MSDKFIPKEGQPSLKSIYELINNATISQENIDEAVSDWQENNTDFDNLLKAEIKEDK